MVEDAPKKAKRKPRSNRKPGFAARRREELLAAGLAPGAGGQQLAQVRGAKAGSNKVNKAFAASGDKKRRRQEGKEEKEEEAAPVSKEGPGRNSLDADGLMDEELEAIVFGRRVGGVASSSSSAAAGSSKGRRGAAAAARPEEEKQQQEDTSKVRQEAAWTDPDDAQLRVDLNAQTRTIKLKKRDGEKPVPGKEYERRLREQFVKVHGHVGWASRERQDAHAEGEEPSDSDEEAPQRRRPVATSARLVAERRGGMLKPQEIDIKRLKNVPVVPGPEDKGPAAIQTVQFHPNSELMLSAGLDKRLHLFSVDGEENTKLSSHFFKKFPISEASFTPNGDQVLLTSEFSKLHLWSLDVSTGTPQVIKPMVAQEHSRFYGLTVGVHPGDVPGMRSSSMFSVLGNSGTVLVCDAATKHPIRTLRMRTAGTAAVFSTTRDTLFTADTECNIYEWDLGSGRCLQRTKDLWATKITRLALSRPSTYSPTPILAVGTTSGNVDLFDAGGPKLSREPTSTMDNLVTSIGYLRFHPSGECLAAASRLKRESLKLLHTGTSTVFQNWPLQAPLGRVSTVDFARRAGLMAVGNEQGRVLVYQLGHFAGGT